MKINKKSTQFFFLISFSFFLLVFPLEAKFILRPPNRQTTENGNGLLIFWLVDKKEGKKIGTYRYLFNLLEKNPHLYLNFSFSPPVLQSWSITVPDLIEKLKNLQRRKQISIVIPPFYEPLLPLLYDYNPVTSFSYPIDIREQIALSFELYQQIFNSLPNGIVPPAGAISPATADLLSEFEIKWVLTGGEEISKSEYLPFTYYLTPGGKEIYLFFRENELSEYWSRKDIPRDWEKISQSPEDSREVTTAKITSTKKKIRQWIREIQEKNYPLTVLTLEGIPRLSSPNEKEDEILSQLFEEILQGNFVTYTAENYILKNPSAKGIDLLKPVCWRKDGFSAWTEKKEKRAAWKLLEQTRAAVEKYKNSGRAEIKTLDTVLGEIYTCESGDNFLHFGEPACEDSEEEIITSLAGQANELTFRLRLINIYRLIGEPIPEELFHPLASYSFLGSLLPEEETKIEIDKNEKLFSLIDLLDNSLDERFDLKNFSCQEKVNSAGKEEIVFSFAFSKTIVLTKVGTTPEIFISTEAITSEMIIPKEEVIISTLSYPVESLYGTYTIETESKKGSIHFQRIFVDLYIDLNNRVGAGSVTLLPGRKALTIPEDAWEYCLTTEITIPEVFTSSQVPYSFLRGEVREAKLYRAKENSPAQEIGKFPVVIASTPTVFSVAIPKEILYGTPMNWGYLVALFKEETDLEGVKIIDLLIPRGKTQKENLRDTTLSPHLSAIRIR